MNERAPHGGGPEDQRSSERERVPYVRAARFPSERAAGRVYSQAQNALFTEPACDLSVYRFALDQVYHVAAVGDPPPEALDRRLSTILAAGTAVTLPPEVLGQLVARRQQQIRRSPGWMEGHYR